MRSTLLGIIAILFLTTNLSAQLSAGDSLLLQSKNILDKNYLSEKLR